MRRLTNGPMLKRKGTEGAEIATKLAQANDLATQGKLQSEIARTPWCECHDLAPVAQSGRSDATERSLPFHWDIDRARMMRLRFVDSIRASSPSGLREQAGHMTA